MTARKGDLLFMTFMMFFINLVTGFAQNKNSDTISIYLGWKYQYQFAGYITALEKGFYRDEGLNVKLIEYIHEKGIQDVISGEFKYGIETGGQLIGKDYGQKLTIVTPVFQQSPLSLVTKKSSGINSLKDLEGKIVRSGPEIQAMIQSAGVNLSKITFESPSTNIGYLDSGESGGVTSYIIDLPYGNTKYLQNYNSFRPIEYGINFYGECLYTSQNEFINHPERVAKIHRATIKGWEYAIAHKDEIIDLTYNKYSHRKSKEELQYEAEIIIHTLILPSHYEIGEYDKGRWIQMAKTLSGMGITDTENIDWDLFLYDPFKDEQKNIIKNILYTSLTIGIILVIFFMILFFYNIQLRKAVVLRTEELEKSNEEIQKKNLLLNDQKEELESHIHFKNQLLSLISHDVRGPLNSIQGILSLVENNQLNQSEFRHLILGTGLKIKAVANFIDNLLFWTKSQLQGYTLSKKSVNLQVVTNELIDLFSHSIKGKKILVINNIHEGIYVYADEEMVKAIFRNLLSNSIKYCSEGDSITLDSEIQGDWVRSRITDTGIGIDKETSEKIFLSKHKSTKGSKNEEGTGLGLLICKEFVEINDGEIGLELMEEKGCRFWFTLKKSQEE